MSKAFTKEDGAGDAPVLRPPIRVAPGERRYITRGGFDALVREREALLEARRADRSKAPAIDARVATLESILAAITVAEPAASIDTVYFGASVELRDEEGETLRWWIVGADEVDAASGRISVDSPAGRALLGKSVGDTVVIRRPKGERELEIVSVSPR